MHTIVWRDIPLENQMAIGDLVFKDKPEELRSLFGWQYLETWLKNNYNVHVINTHLQFPNDEDYVRFVLEWL